MTDEEYAARCAALGLRPAVNPLGDTHHTDAPLTDDDKALGTALACVLGDIGADIDGVKFSFLDDMSPEQQWQRVARALRVHGLKIANEGGSMMDPLGDRIVRDNAAAREKRELADKLESDARALRLEADEIERLLELARRQG